MDSLKAAKPDPIGWNVVQQFNFPDNYTPVMALAQNHIHFLDVGSDDPGTARIFVIHFSYLQPQPQNYSGDKIFPDAHGQATSFFKDSGVQQEFAFIPDDFSATYVTNVESNSTQTLPPPKVKDTKASYVAGITSLLQLDSTGAVSFVPYKPGVSSSNVDAAWSGVKALAIVAPPGSGGTSSSNGPQATGNVGSTNTGNTNTSQSGGALSSYAVTSGLVGFSVLFAILRFL